MFNISSLRLAASDPLLSQIQDDQEPEPIVVDGEEEYLVEAIIDQQVHQRKRQYLVRWMGYLDLTWEPAECVTNTKALQL